MMSPDLNSLHNEIEIRFIYREGISVEKTEKMSRIRVSIKELAHRLVDLTPVCREQSLALTALQEALMYSIASLTYRESEHE